MKTKATFLLALILATGTAAAGEIPASRTRVMTLTRTAVLFSGLESRLDTALRGKDPAELAALLTDDFELREATAPAQPVPRAEWLKRPAPAGDVAISQVGVHDFGDTAVVSFAQEQADDSHAGARTQRMIVDVWRRIDGSWRLAVRFQPASAAPLANEDVAPTGKG